MAEQKSRLVIEIDSENAKRNAKAINEELKKMESGGVVAANSIRNIGDEANKQNPKLKSFQESIKALAAEGKIYFASLAGTALGSMGALVALAVQTANTAAEIERLAYLSGTTTTEFQEWAVGSRAMGIEMDKLSDIFKDTRDRIGDFITTGGGELSDFFTEIAVKTEGSADGALKLAKAMRELSGADALQLYVDKLEEAGVSQNEMVFFMESVADEATALIPLLENGGEGFRLWAEAARDAGTIMDQETLVAAQRLKVEAELLEMQMQGLKNQFMEGLLPALNQIAGAFLTSSNEGLRFNSVGEAVGNTMIWLAQVGTGVAATFDIVGKTIGGAAAAMANESVTHQMVLDDLGKTIDSWGTKFNKLKDNSSNNKLVESLTKVQIRANEASKSVASTAVNTNKMKETFDKAAGSSKKVADNTARLKREAERAAEEVRRIVYEYSTGDDKKRLDLEKEITHLRKNGMEQYIPLAQARYNEESKLIKMKYEYDLVEHQLTEEKKLRYSYNIKEQEIKADADLTKQQRAEKLESLKSEFDQELKLIQIAKETRMFQMREAFLSETAAMEARYALEEQRIIEISDIEERNFKLQMLRLQKQEEVRNRLNQAVQNWGGIQADMNGTGEQWRLEQDRFSRTDASQELFDSKMSLIDQMEKDPNADFGEIARMREQIWFEHHERLRVIEGDYQSKSIGLQAAYGAQFADIMMGMVDESSSAYAVLGGIQKGFALFSTAMNSYTAISAAWASAPFPYNLPAVATATIETGLLQAAVSALSPQGYSDGGFTGYGAKYDPAGIVHKGEVVWSQDDIKRWGGVAAVESMRTSKPPKGYANGGIVSPKDTNRMAQGQLDAIQSGANLQAERQAQANAKVQAAQPSVNLNPNFVIVDERESLSDYLFSPDGTKAFVKFFKRNRSALGI